VTRLHMRPVHALRHLIVRPADAISWNDSYRTGVSRSVVFKSINGDVLFNGLC
jgi:hypothetical protein